MRTLILFLAAVLSFNTFAKTYTGNDYLNDCHYFMNTGKLDGSDTSRCIDYTQGATNAILGFNVHSLSPAINQCIMTYSKGFTVGRIIIHTYHLLQNSPHTLKYSAAFAVADVIYNQFKNCFPYRQQGIHHVKE